MGDCGDCGGCDFGDCDCGDCGCGDCGSDCICCDCDKCDCVCCVYSYDGGQCNCNCHDCGPCCVDNKDCCTNCCNLFTCFMCTGAVDDCFDSCCERTCENCCMAMSNPQPTRNMYVSGPQEPRRQNMYRNELRESEAYEVDPEHLQNGDANITPNGPPPPYDEVVSTQPGEPTGVHGGAITYQPGYTADITQTQI